jgi:hypothetical protein
MKNKIPKCLECSLPAHNIIDLEKTKIGLCEKHSKIALGGAILCMALKVGKHQGKRTDLALK